MFKSLRIAAMAAALTALLAAPVRAEPFTVLLDWFLNPDHAPLVVAAERGYFAEAGLEVEMIEPADPNDPPKLVAAQKADVAVTYQPSLYLQIDQGLPLRRIATLVATPLNTLLVLEDGPIDAIADLRGAKIGYSVGGFEDAVLGAMLAEAGLGLDDVELINVNFSLSPSLLSGQVDAVIGAFRNFELNQLQIEGYEGRAFYPEAHGVPAYDELILVAHETRLDDPRMKAFVQALQRGVQYLVNHPEESWGHFIAYKPEVEDELNRRAWADTLARFALRPAALDHGRYRAFAAFMKESGLIAEARPVEAYAADLFE